MKRQIMCMAVISLVGGMALPCIAGVMSHTGGEKDFWDSHHVVIINVTSIALDSEKGNDVARASVIATQSEKIKANSSVEFGLYQGATTALTKRPVITSRTYLVCLYENRDGSLTLGGGFVSFFPSGIPAIRVNGSNDPTYLKMVEVIGVMKQKDGSEKIKKLIALVNSGDDSKRLAVLPALPDYFRRASASDQGKIKDTLLSVRNTASDVGLRLTADQLLASCCKEYAISSDREAFLKQTGVDSSNATRNAVRQLLRQVTRKRIIESPKRNEELIAIVNSEDRANLWWALNLLESYEAEEAIPAIKALVRRNSKASVGESVMDKATTALKKLEALKEAKQASGE